MTETNHQNGSYEKLTPTNNNGHEQHFRSRESSIEMQSHDAVGRPKRLTNDGDNLLTIGAGASAAGNKDGGKQLSDFELKLKRARMTAAWFGEHGYFSSLMSVITIYTLYQSDIRLAATGKEADEGFMIVASIIFFIFLFEIFLQSFYKDGYCYIPSWAAEPDESWTDTWWRRMQVGSFYFWLDWIATLTLIFDVSTHVDRQIFEITNDHG